MASKGLKTVIQVLLAIVIIGLSYFLYVSVTGPWEEVERQREMRDLTRERMLKVSEGLRLYDRQQGRFPHTLDSLVMWVKADSFMAATQDSILGISPDSLPFSPRTGKRFVYSVNDTGRVAIYLLKDPDSEDQIGSEIPDVTQLNAASWQ